MAFRNTYATGGLLAAVALAIVALAGCGQAATSTAGTGTAVNTVTAPGTGTAQAVPDTAEMSFGITTTSSNAKSALDDAAKAAEQITAAVKKQGIAAEDIQTQDVSVYPQTSDENGKQIVTSYQASLSVRVKVRDIAKLGEIISAANAAGANTISGPAFTIDDPAPVRAQAIDEAVADARKSAEAMAKAAGKSVGAVLSMSSGDVGPIPRLMYEQSADVAGAAKDVPIEPGRLDVTASVVVVFELE
ncbi:MAG: SIMPL domain-containing protein [Actinobacteria bacterium]|nr:SIMPL domain-containing protein [Actinomycetota bacterium]